MSQEYSRLLKIIVLIFILLSSLLKALGIVEVSGVTSGRGYAGVLGSKVIGT